MEYIKLEDCVKGKAYRIHSRNLKLGVFDGNAGFIGIRTKFGDRYLFREYHWDSPSFATVRPLEDLGITVFDFIPLMETLGTRDQNTNREVEFDTPVSEGGRGWYYKDTGEPDTNIRPIAMSNDELFKFLEDLEKQFEEQNG